jgi:hypothetical protein
LRPTSDEPLMGLRILIQVFCVIHYFDEAALATSVMAECPMGSGAGGRGGGSTRSASLHRSDDVSCSTTIENKGEIFTGCVGRTVG